ncbi:MAG TPA: tetratricopeptide repeat protein [Lacunisphaera sp.]
MSQLPSANRSQSTAKPAAVPADPGFEDNVQALWDKNKNFILLLCALILVGIIVREGWQYFSEMREKSRQEDYARASDKPDQLVAFAEANADHPLAGVAYLQVADRKFESGDYKDASTLYTKAAGSLKNDALLGRAKLGSAVSLIESGDSAGGESALKAVGADQTLPKTVRAEATYHLAAIASEAGRTEDAKKLVDDVTKIDAGGPWAQRATMLLSTLSSGDKAIPATSGFSLKPEGK